MGMEWEMNLFMVMLFLYSKAKFFFSNKDKKKIRSTQVLMFILKRFFFFSKKIEVIFANATLRPQKKIENGFTEKYQKH